MHNHLSIYGKAAAAVATVMAVLSLGYVAGAVDPDGGATADGFTSLTTFVTGSLATGLFALAIAAIAITMGVRWLRKGARA